MTSQGSLPFVSSRSGHTRRKYLVLIFIKYIYLLYFSPGSSSKRPTKGRFVLLMEYISSQNILLIYSTILNFFKGFLALHLHCLSPEHIECFVSTHGIYFSPEDLEKFALFVNQCKRTGNNQSRACKIASCFARSGRQSLVTSEGSPRVVRLRSQQHTRRNDVVS